MAMLAAGSDLCTRQAGAAAAATLAVQMAAQASMADPAAGGPPPPPPWDALPADLLGRIFSHLPDPASCAAARATCTWWRAAADECPAVWGDVAARRPGTPAAAAAAPTPQQLEALLASKRRLLRSVRLELCGAAWAGQVPTLGLPPEREAEAQARGLACVLAAACGPGSGLTDLTLALCGRVPDGLLEVRGQAGPAASTLAASPAARRGGEPHSATCLLLHPPSRPPALRSPLLRAQALPGAAAQLTSLALQPLLGSGAALRWERLPASLAGLRQLSLACDFSSAGPPAGLSAITALTRLRLHVVPAQPGSAWWDMHLDGESLLAEGPPSLRRLEVEGVRRDPAPAPAGLAGAGPPLADELEELEELEQLEELLDDELMAGMLGLLVGPPAAPDQPAAPGAAGPPPLGNFAGSDSGSDSDADSDALALLALMEAEADGDSDGDEPPGLQSSSDDDEPPPLVEDEEARATLRQLVQRLQRLQAASVVGFPLFPYHGERGAPGCSGNAFTSAAPRVRAVQACLPRELHPTCGRPPPARPPPPRLRSPAAPARPDVAARGAVRRRPPAVHALQQPEGAWPAAAAAGRSHAIRRLRCLRATALPWTACQPCLPCQRALLTLTSTFLPLRACAGAEPGSLPVAHAARGGGGGAAPAGAPAAGRLAGARRGAPQLDATAGPRGAQAGGV